MEATEILVEDAINNEQIITILNNEILNLNKKEVVNVKQVKIVFPLMWFSFTLMIIGFLISYGVIGW